MMRIPVFAHKYCVQKHLNGKKKLLYNYTDHFLSALFDYSDLDYDGFDWAIGISWQPIERSKVEFSTQNNTNKTNGEGNFIKQKSYNASWSHVWFLG
jgi:hypothetical protein